MSIRTIETIFDKSEQADAKAGACAPYLLPAASI
jgi:hypothetical protein